VDEYLREASTGNHWWVRAFDCEEGDCRRAQAQASSGPVTAAPIALLLGPGCRSSCDTFAAIWTRERFGPSVGTAPAAMYTSIRYPLAVTLGDEILGDFSVALCGLRFRDEEPWLEGQPLRLDSVVESSWPPGSADAAIVRAAVEALRGRPPEDSSVSPAK
jgi:hypothetical protein